MTASDFSRRTRETYDKIAGHYNAANHDSFWVKELARFKKLVPGKKVLDIGCGAGRDAEELLKEGFCVTGIDASDGMLAVARSRAPKATLLKMDFNALAFPDESFDGFWAAASFLHVPKAEVGKPLLEAKRILKRGGVGFIALKERNGMSEGVIEEARYGGIARYFSFYEEDEFKGHLDTAGFEFIECMKFHEQDERKTVWLSFFVRKV